MKVGLVLEGGAMRGIYTAGVLDTFLKNNIKIDGIIGVSAGALFGVNFVSNQLGRVIRYNKRFLNDKRYMGFHSLITTGDIINKEFCYNEMVYKLDPFDFETFKKSEIDFYATITNIETGEAEYIKLKDLEKNMDYLRASGSMPLVSKIVEIGDKKYLDGGISDSIPVEKAKKLGYDKIIVVLTRPIEYRKKRAKMLPYKIAYKKYPKFINTLKNRYLNYNNTVEKIIDYENKKEIFVIRPSRKVNIKRLEKNVNTLEEMYKLGIEDCNNRLKDLREYING